MSFLRQFARVPIFHLVVHRARPSISPSRNLGLAVIPPSIHTKAKKRSLLDQWSARLRKEMQDEEVTKPGEQKKHTTTLSDTDDDTAEGGALLFFSGDVSSTPVDLAAVETHEPLGINRAARRRNEQIEQRRKRIRKKMGIREGSTEQEEAQVEKALDKWITTADGKARAKAKYKKTLNRIKSASVRDRTRTRKSERRDAKFRADTS
ncbi:hypothetical protein F4782DRAFT_492793 [Xylaria castorea]|nr:hypothetical protein F4782DRAFT_492793 [Xylaria castorea]